MTRVFLVLLREYLENVRTKAFLIGVVLTPLWFGLVFLAPLLAEHQEAQTQQVEVVDTTNVLADDVRDALAEHRTTAGRPLYAVDVVKPADVRKEAPAGSTLFDALKGPAARGEKIVVLLTRPVLEKRPPREGEEEGGILHAATAGAFEAAQVIRGIVGDVVNRHIMAERGIDPADAALLQKPALATHPLSRTGEEGGVAQFVTPIVFMLFLFMGIVSMSQVLVNSTIEEKATRVYEVLLSSVSPFQLMAGKVLGICAVGFTLMALWAGGGLAAAAVQGIGGIVTEGQIGLFVAFYLLGFFMIASLMVAVGSACNTLKEAQNLMAPISMLLALPLLLAIVVLKNPQGGFATVASFFPPFTPFLMMARIGSVPGPPAWQIWTSLLLLAVAAWFSVRLAGRIFRVGILMVGKPPRLGEILRWLRASR